MRQHQSNSSENLSETPFASPLELGRIELNGVDRGRLGSEKLDDSLPYLGTPQGVQSIATVFSFYSGQSQRRARVG